ncbi:MAG: RimK family alpha-L-glutamate ligase [archaeon GB-1867-035]|nr:RimK family alpha-L-glutamate ligase [Candidatus Culexmicrobium profundum]
MIIGILTRRPKSWYSIQLKEAIENKGHKAQFFTLSRMIARIGYKPYIEQYGVDLLRTISALIVRPIGRGTLDQCIFRLDILHKLAEEGLPVINNPKAIERCLDKYQTLMLLEKMGLPVPKTAVTENIEEAMKAFYELGEDVVVKPLFGARGIGIVRVNDPDIAIRVFRTINLLGEVIYIQEFISHGTRDIRAFVIGNKVVASMYREANSWKTNVAQGAKPTPLKISGKLEELAVKAAKITGCEIAGVDILEGPDGYYITEINSQPGWQGLQTVTQFNIAEKIIEYIIKKIRR